MSRWRDFAVNDETNGADWQQQEEVLHELWTIEQGLLRADPAYSQWLDKPENEVKTSEMIQSKFLKKEDFQTPTVLTIKSVSLEEVGRGDTRWVLFFNERAKGIVLNVTKIRQLESRYGVETDFWIGKKIRAENDPTVMMGTQVVGGIKFTMPSGGTDTPPPVEPEETFDDDVPF